MRFLHPTADFPLNSRWVDDAGRYTDEGWYASGAIDHLIQRTWILRGDFNPIVDVPIWPLMLSAWFHIIGFGMGPARELASLCSCAVVLLVGLLMARYEPVLALPAAVLIASSPILFFFGRLALLEPLMLVFVLLAMLLVSKLPEGGRGYLRAGFAGLLMTAAILTKTTALFFIPATVSLILVDHRGKRSFALRSAVLLCAVVGAASASYWAFVIHPHIGDHIVLMKENGFYFGFKSVRKFIRVFYRGFTWTDPILFPLALIASVTAFTSMPTLRRHSLIVCSWMWCIGYTVFVVGHYAADPRYFTVFVPPAIFLSLIFAKHLYESNSSFFRVVSAAIAIAAVWNIGYVIWRQSQPQYTFRSASAAIASTVRAYPDSKPLLLGHGIGGLTLYTGLPVLNEFGTYSLGQKLDVYRPGWILVWQEGVSLATAGPVTERYNVIFRGTFSALDQVDRHQLILYQLIPRR